MSNTRTTRKARTEGEQPRLCLSSPADILAVVPYLLGFHPGDSIVVLGVGGPRLRVRITSRADLPLAGDVAASEAGAQRVAEMLCGKSVEQVIVVAYGTDDRARPAVDHIRVALDKRGIGVREALRAHGGFYWSYECSDPTCCPPEGTAYDIGTSRVAAAATVAGLVALPDRKSLERSIAPVGGVARVSMRQATSRAEDRVETWATESSDPAALRRRLLDEGSTRVRAALECFGSGSRDLSDDDTAFLGVVLKLLQVRDEAWLLIDEDSARAHVDLWTHLTRRAEEYYVPAAASLLAFAAWQSGNGALASIAVDRALEADPDYSMAHLIGDVLDRGLLPNSWQPPVTQTELAGLYDRAARDEAS